LQKASGDIITDIDDLEEMTKQFYSDLYTSKRGDQHATSLGLVPIKATTDMNVSLNANYSLRSEIVDVVLVTWER